MPETATQSNVGSLTLPRVVNPRNRYGMVLFATTVFVGLYLFTNHYHWREPQLLPMSWIDEITPFLPGTIWIYMTAYVGIALAFLLLRDLDNQNRLFYAFLSLVMVSASIFWFFPTTFPRELFPLPSDGLDWLTHLAFSLTREADTPANCAPSLHVSGCFLVAFSLWRESRVRGGAFVLWAAIVGVSTLTTKQHYLIDFVTGAGLAALIHWLFHWRIRLR